MMTSATLKLRGSFMADLQSDLFTQETQPNAMAEILSKNFNS